MFNKKNVKILKEISKKIKYRLIFILFILVLKVNSEQISLPLKLVNSTFSKYSSVEYIFIKTNDLSNINLFNSVNNKFLQNSQQALSSKIEILNSFLFAAEIEIGSNSQKFNVILDTGSQILWVPENNSLNNNNYIKNYYDPSQSKTAQSTLKEFEILYGTGYCQGYYYKDLIKFLSNDKYEIFFGLANNSIFNVEGADGILGLAKTYPNNLYSPILTLKNNGFIKSTSFSFKYNWLENSLFMYAGKPHKDFDSKNIAFCNLLSNTYYEKILWACQLNSLGFIKDPNNPDNEENIFIKTNTSVIFDTGTNLMILPYKIINSLKEKIKKYNCIIGSSSYNSDEDTSFVVCFDIDRIPDISLEFNDYILVLDKHKMFFTIDFGYGIIGYLLNIQFQKDLAVAIIGQNFFTEFHTLFDPENNVLKFYSDNIDKIIRLKGNTEGNNSILGITFIFLIIIILIGVYFYYRYQKKKRIESSYEWMGQNGEINMKFNNIKENV